MKHWQSSLVFPKATIEHAISVIDKSGLKMALVIDQEQKLLGIVTDGDIRRAILRHLPLTTPVSIVMQSSPITLLANRTDINPIKLMNLHAIEQLPLVNSDGILVGLYTLSDFTTPKKIDNTVVLMAGGQGIRLRPLTNNCPKPLLKVGNKPLLETIINKFIDYDFHNFYLSVNYLSNMVKDYFEDGSKWGVNIKYLEEDRPLGTAGALGLLPESALDYPVIVMNGDILTQVDFSSLIKYHTNHAAAATMCVREWEYQIPYGVVKLDGNQMAGISEKPIEHYFINAGIYVLEKTLISSIKQNQYLDMPSLLDETVKNSHKVTLFPIREYWLDIGHIHDFERANVDINEASYQ